MNKGFVLWTTCGWALCVHLPALAQPSRGHTDPSTWHVTLGGISSHAGETRAPGRQWNETHAGLGLERRVHGLPWNTGADAGWASRYTFGTLVDSREFLGGYAGLAVLHQVARAGTLQLDAGANAALYYRSTSWDGRMKLVPAVMPALSLTERRSGVGVNLVWVPPLDWGGRRTVSTVLLQLSYRVAH